MSPAGKKHRAARKSSAVVVPNVHEDPLKISALVTPRPAVVLVCPPMTVTRPDPAYETVT
jgi:hypothetical protein